MAPSSKPEAARPMAESSPAASCFCGASLAKPSLQLEQHLSVLLLQIYYAYIYIHDMSGHAAYILIYKCVYIYIYMYILAYT